MWVSITVIYRINGNGQVVNIIDNYNELINEKLFEIIKEFIQSILDDYKKSKRSVNIVLCNNDFIRKLNFQYRNKDYPTDVLSFSQDEGEAIETGRFDESNDLGDIIISIDKTQSQAREFGVSFNEELARLCIHGTLHLLGYEHKMSSENEAKMMEKQYFYLEKFIKHYL